MPKQEPNHISIDEVINVARLCHLDFTSEELNQLSIDMASLLKEVEVLQEIDTSNIVPSAHAIPSVHTIMRDDIPHKSLSQEAVLQNAPKRDGDFFRVAQVMDKS